MRAWIRDILQGSLLAIGGGVLISCQSANLKEARDRYVRGEYYAAARAYREIYRSVPREQHALRGMIAYEMAENHRHLNQAMQAAAAYRNAIRYGYPDTLMRYHLAQMLHREGNYEEAALAYRDFLALRPDDPMGLSGLKGVEMAMKWIDSPTRFQVHLEPLFNSNRGDFCPMLSPKGDRLYFTSSREGVYGDMRSPVTGMKYNDLFYAETNVHGEWKQPKRIDSGANTEFDEGTASFSPDGEWMYYTQSFADPNRATGTSIYASRRVDGEWSRGRPLLEYVSDTLGLPAVSFAHPAASPCNNYLYFVSDMPGGIGGKDIWKATLTHQKGRPDVIAIENMGPDINSVGDEMFPYSRNDTTLYFSSDGHPGMGGLDLFVAVKGTGAKRWSVQNMRPPINSPADDFGITFYRHQEKGYFSSNRDDARGYDYIFSFEYIKPVMRVEGIVVDHEDEFIPGASVMVVGSNGFNERFTADSKGEYRFEADAGVEYLFLASAKGFLNKKEALPALPVKKDTLMYVDFEMIPFNRPVVIEHVFYDFDSAGLRPESKEALEGLVDLMNGHPEVFMELEAHTDRIGSEEYNRELSRQRAQSVVDYLVEKGVDRERLSSVGYGKSHPLIVGKRLAAGCNFLKIGDVLSEEFIKKLEPDQQKMADQLNRRTSFVITGKGL